MPDRSEAAFVADPATLPSTYPTHCHARDFWEALGRVVATFGFLEEVLLRAVFALTGTREVPMEGAETRVRQWIAEIERSASDTLGPLIEKFDKAAAAHPDLTLANLKDLVADLREVAGLRNVVCHGSWRAPDAQGRSIPFFVDRKGKTFASHLDSADLMALQERIAHLAAAVVSTVTHMGWQFPGTGGPGKPIFSPAQKHGLVP